MYPYNPAYAVAPYPTASFVFPSKKALPWSVSSTASQLPPETPRALRPPPAPYLPPIPLPPEQVAEKRAARKSMAPHTVRRSSTPEPSATCHDYPHIHRLLALTADPEHTIPFLWDVGSHPETLLRNYEHIATPGSLWEMLESPAARLPPQNGGQPLRSLTLVISAFPMWIDVLPNPSSSRNTQFGPSLYVTVWELLVTLHSVLHMPIDHKTLGLMTRAEHKAVNRSAIKRVQRNPPGDDAAPGFAPRRIDFLDDRRIFLGIRVAERADLPEGKRFGEVFQVELGRI
ncbi:hypothetical protein FKP32DRAFT_1677654 [Trametes sanguinea]|nr:hypothetical protein FKP32DRAFT_1677654 [Trametes sanguinea]